MKKIVMLTLLILILSYSTSFAASPVIYFSDLTSGPKTGGQNNKGAFVTIWGKNFGSSQGASYVSIGGGQADNYPVWTDTKISFQLGAGASTGNIVVTTSSGTSNGVFFTVRSGNIYFVKTSGNDTSGDGSWNNPWRTIVKLKNTLVAGDIGYVGDGVNQTTLDDQGACINLGSHGTQANPKALVVYPGASSTVGNSGIGAGFNNYVSGGSGGYQGKYWVISQFNITAQTTAINRVSDGCRIIGNKITVPTGDGPTAAVEVGAYGGSHIKLLGNELYNCGVSGADKMYHNIYIDNNTGSANAINTDIEVGWNIIRNSHANRGVQTFADLPLSEISIHDNLFHDLRGNAININYQSTGNFYVYNNVIYACAKGPESDTGGWAGINMDYCNPVVYLYNNTVYDCGSSVNVTDSGLLRIGPNFTGLVYPRGNIFYSTGQNYEPYLVSDSISPVTGGHKNLFYGRGTGPGWDTSGLSYDPLFSDLTNKDFHLQANSPCIDKGFDTTALVGRDRDGLARPQATAVDIGAYEYESGQGVPLLGDMNSDNQVNIQDIQACVNHILGAQDWGSNADVNGDSSVNILDVQRIANIILGE